MTLHSSRSRWFRGAIPLLGAWMLSGGGFAAGAGREDADPLLETIRQKHDLPALAVVVVQDGRIVEEAAAGVRKQGDRRPVTTSDRFHIGSCTKAMTATLAAMFIEEGKLGWDTTIGEVFPEWRRTMDPAYQNVTVAQLLQHRGGCPHDPPPDAWKRAWEQRGSATRQRTEFIAAILRLPPEAEPGTKHIYSNQGYAILGAMLEKLGQKPWETLLTERLFGPLGMKTAGFGVPGAIGRVDQPWGHVRKDGKIEPVQSDNPPAIGPGGTVHCALGDLARFAMLHLRRGEGENALLQPDTFRKLHAPPEGQTYAGGWMSVPRGWAGGNALTHAGSNTMWYAVMWLAPEKDFAVVTGTNIAGDAAEKGCDEVAAAMIGKWLGGR